MAEKQIINKGDKFNFGLYIMAKPNIKAKALLNKDFNNFCIIHANDDIQYKITKKPGIYAFRKISENKIVYIGQAIDINNRMRQHANDGYNQNLKAYNTHLHSAIRKYGPQDFEVELLEVLTELDYNKLDQLEQEYIKKFNTYQDIKSYNHTIGGQDGSTATGIASNFRIDYEPDIEKINTIRKYLKQAEDDKLYLTPEQIIKNLNIPKLTTYTLSAINNGIGVYYDKNYNGEDIDNKKAIYHFPKISGNIAKTEDAILCTIFVANDSDKPISWQDSCIVRDHANRPLVFIGNHAPVEYINRTYGITTIDDRVLKNIISGNRVNHTLIAKYIGVPMQIYFPKADLKAISDNSKEILTDIKFTQIYVDCVVMVEVDTAKELRFKKTYGCALHLASLGLINYEDRFKVAATILSSKLNKNKEYFGYMYYTEKVKLQDYYKLN